MKYIIKEIMFNDIFKNMDQSVQFLAKYYTIPYPFSIKISVVC